MKSLFGILLLSIFCFTSCKKEDEIIEIEQEIYNPNVTSCQIPELNYHLDSVFYGPSNMYPQAKFRVKFVDTLPSWGQGIYTVEFAFNKIPTTGMYHMVFDIDTNQFLLNQIAYVNDSIGLYYRSTNTNNAEVYIENNDDELIISFCDISNQYAYIDPFCNCIEGNLMKNLKAIKKY
jgi:hypothetical protein